MGYNDAAHHEQLRQRFRNVIEHRGYGPLAVEGILEEWFPQYIEDIGSFENMLKCYEDNSYDPTDEQLDAGDKVRRAGRLRQEARNS